VQHIFTTLRGSPASSTTALKQQNNLLR